MKTTLEDGEVAYFNDTPWLVTNKRICSPMGMVLLADVRSVEVLVDADTSPWSIVKMFLGKPFRLTLNLHCESGVRTLYTISRSPYANSADSKDFLDDCAKVHDVKRAIGNALAAR